MAPPMRARVFGPESFIAVASQLGVRLGMTRQTLRLLIEKIMLPQQHPALDAYSPTGSDVFVATFAKSGTNWAMQMCLQIAHRGSAEFRHVHHLVAWPEVPYPQVVPLDDPRPLRSSPTGMRVIKSHMPAGSVPYDPAAKYVTIIRDPKEVVVSAYFFVLGLLGIRDRVTPKEWITLAMSEQGMARRWAAHSAGFWAWRKKPNVLVRTFADLRRDHDAAVDDLASLMDVELTAEERSRVIERSTFSHMKSIDDRFAPPRSPFVRADLHPNMMRRGVSGRSDELVDDEDRALIDAACREQLARLGSDLPYDELFGPRH